MSTSITTVGDVIGRTPLRHNPFARARPSQRSGTAGDAASAPLFYRGRVLRIDRATYDAIVAHAREDHPDEACGVVAGPEGSDRPERFIPMLNAARSPTFYEFDSGDLLRLYRDMDDRGEVPVVVYHSHTATEARPSRTDISYASEPEAHYVLVSTREHGTQTGLAGDDVEFRSFRIVDGEVNEEDVEVVESYLFGHSPTTVVYD